MYFPIILGAHRQERRSGNVAAFVEEQLKEQGIETEVIDTRDYLSSLVEDMSTFVEEYTQKMERMDGLYLVVSEYNWGYPGALKMLLDEILEPYFHKPVAFCGVSSGRIGGERAHVNMLPVFHELGMRHVAAVSFGNVKDLFDAQGKITDEKYIERVANSATIMKAYARALQHVREELRAE